MANFELLSGGSLANPMFITAFGFWLGPGVTESLAAGLDLGARPSAWWGLNWNPFDSQCNP